MRRIVMAVMGTISGLVLLFSYHTSTSSRLAGTAVTAAAGDGASSPLTPSAAAPSAAAPSAAAPSAAAPSAAAPTTSAPAAPAASAGTFTGDAVDTRWGAVQVQITVQDGKITQAQAVEYPQNNGRDQQINAYAVPTLNQEAVTAQSAHIDAVSGATVTSDGYLQSLQSAIDQAHL